MNFSLNFSPFVVTMHWSEHTIFMQCKTCPFSVFILCFTPENDKYILIHLIKKTETQLARAATNVTSDIVSISQNWIRDSETGVEYFLFILCCHHYFQILNKWTCNNDVFDIVEKRGIQVLDEFLNRKLKVERLIDSNVLGYGTDENTNSGNKRRPVGANIQCTAYEKKESYELRTLRQHKTDDNISACGAKLRIFPQAIFSHNPLDITECICVCYDNVTASTQNERAKR